MPRPAGGASAPDSRAAVQCALNPRSVAVLGASDDLMKWGGSILAPLLNRQALNAQVDVSMAQRNQALFSYEKTVRGAFKEVNDSLDAIGRYGEQLAELQAQEKVAQETLRIAQNRYRNGYSSYLDVLDAQRTLFSTQLSVVQVKNNLLLAQVDLYRSLGGGWSDSSGT